MTTYSFIPEDDGRLFWCNMHQRRATHTFGFPVNEFSVCCNPSLPGIMMPCSCVELTDQVEIDQ